MTREKSPNREKALKIWLKSGRQKKSTEIAAELGVNPSMVRRWKSTDKWDEIPASGRPRGAKKGNQNAKGNKGGKGGPEGNQKALKHGFFSKFMPQDPEFLEIREIVETMSPADMIWESVITLYQRLIWGRRITHVKDRDDVTKVLKKKKPGMFGTEQEWEYQQAWDKYNSAIKAEATVMKELRSAIKQFIEIAPEKDERRLKLDKMKAEIEKTRIEIERLKNGVEDSEDDLIEDWVAAVSAEGDGE
ncbi:phage terminase small subunit [Paenibacillus sp. FSL R7-0179]|uniref:phage terminase small subunit n=1 Tax=Paenibacillus sp. FSL R7-0179 TaxID=2921672 RepID=UPI0030FCA112